MHEGRNLNPECSAGFGGGVQRARGMVQLPLVLQRGGGGWGTLVTGTWTQRDEMRQDETASSEKPGKVPGSHANGRGLGHRVHLKNNNAH